MAKNRASPGIKLEKKGDKLTVSLYKVVRGNRRLCAKEVFAAADKIGWQTWVEQTMEAEREAYRRLGR